VEVISTRQLLISSVHFDHSSYRRALVVVVSIRNRKRTQDDPFARDSSIYDGVELVMWGPVSR
jgi:hypothetical protein